MPWSGTSPWRNEDGIIVGIPAALRARMVPQLPRPAEISPSTMLHFNIRSNPKGRNWAVVQRSTMPQMLESSGNDGAGGGKVFGERLMAAIESQNYAFLPDRPSM